MLHLAQTLTSTAAAGQRRLLHELSRSEQSDSPTKKAVVPGDLNADFENVSDALGIGAGGSAGLEASSRGAHERPHPSPASSRNFARCASRYTQDAKSLAGSKNCS